MSGLYMFFWYMLLPFPMIEGAFFLYELNLAALMLIEPLRMAMEPDRIAIEPVLMETPPALPCPPR